MVDLSEYWASDSRHSDKALIQKEELPLTRRLDIAKALRPQWTHIEASEAGGATNTPQIDGVEASCALVTPSAIRQDGADGAPPGKGRIGSTDTLLTPHNVLDRFRMTTAEQAKWMRRAFKKHGLPFMHACGQIRPTETI